MRANRKLLAVLLLALASVATAQRVYRSVGPDGKVVFSDTPPPDREAVALPAGRAKPGTAIAPASSPAAAGAAGTPSQATIDAAARSLAILTDTEMLVRAFEKTCTATLPTSAGRYSSAADAWRGRHGELLARRDAALAQLKPVQSNAVLAESAAGMRRLMQPVQAGRPEQRIKWCDNAAEEILGGKLDKHNDPSITGPLKNVAAR